MTVSPQKQKQKTQEALVAWISRKRQKGRRCTVLGKISTGLIPLRWRCSRSSLTKCPRHELLALLTFRPEFTPPWGNPRRISARLTLSRLGRSHVETMVEQVSGGKALPSEVVQQIVGKTDGVPLFVEELTKTVVESVESKGSIESGGRLDRSALSLGIPATLQDALMARLDRLGAAKEIAQVGAALPWGVARFRSGRQRKCRLSNRDCWCRIR